MLRCLILTTSLYRVNKFCFQVAMVVVSKKVFNQDLQKSQMKVVQSEIVESKKRAVLAMEEGQDMSTLGSTWPSTS